MATSPGTLYLVPNLLDFESSPEASLPALAIGRVRELRHFVVEGEKAAWKLLSAILDREAASQVLMSRLDEHTTEEELPALLLPLEKGLDVGLISEAGIPCVADPGAALVALAHRRGIPVVPLVGPSSIMLALSASGLDGQRFSFLGYLPADSEERRRALVQLDGDIRRDAATRIFIETPYRNARLLEDCLAQLSPQICLCIAASLCGPKERISTRTIEEWKKSEKKALEAKGEDKEASFFKGKEPAIFLLGLEAKPGRPQGKTLLASSRPQSQQGARPGRSKDTLDLRHSRRHS